MVNRVSSMQRGHWQRLSQAGTLSSRMSILREAIAVPPSNLGAYLRIRQKNLSAIHQALQDAAALIAETREEGGDLLYRFIRLGANPDDAITVTGWLTDAVRRPSRHVPAEDLIQMIAAWIKHGSTFARYVTERLSHAEPLDDELRSAMASLSTAEAGMIEYGYQPGDPANADDPEFVAAMRLLHALRNGTKALREGVQEIENMKRKLAAQDEMRDGLASQGWSRTSWRPKHDEVETLYHATAFADEVARGGFTLERPMNRRGLGNYGEQKGISFTYDLHVAHTIMRALREMWMIAHGKITTATILRWMQHEGIDPQRAYSIVDRPKPGVEYAARLYRAYLALTKLRTDPVMTYPEEIVRMLESRPRMEDIGIVAAEVRIDPSDEFLVAEREFRVPPERVLRVWRVM